MDLPGGRNDQQQAPARGQHTKQLGHHPLRLGNVLERDDVQARREPAIPKRERREVGDAIQPRIVPAGIADSEIDGHVPLAAERSCMPRFARPGIQHPRTLRQPGGELRHGVVDAALEVHDVTAEEPGQRSRQTPVPHRFLRASIITVLPAWHAASSSAKGSEAATRKK